jgi:hypothetical protein
MIGGFESRRRLGIFLFTTVSTPALGPTKPPIQWIPGTLSLDVKRPGREADDSPQSSAEVKECVELCLHSPNTLSWRGAQLKTGATLHLHLHLPTSIWFIFLCINCTLRLFRTAIFNFFIDACHLLLVLKTSLVDQFLL